MISDDEKAEFLEATFRLCLDQVLADKEFMEQYRRLTGHTIMAPVNRVPIERLVDEAAGHDPHAIKDEEAQHLFAFVRDYVWKPWLAKMEADAAARAQSMKGKK